MLPPTPLPVSQPFSFIRPLFSSYLLILALLSFLLYLSLRRLSLLVPRPRIFLSHAMVKWPAPAQCPHHSLHSMSVWDLLRQLKQGGEGSSSFGSTSPSSSPKSTTCSETLGSIPTSSSLLGSSNVSVCVRDFGAGSSSARLERKVSASSSAVAVGVARIGRDIRGCDW
jgi:hypothetical protein